MVLVGVFYNGKCAIDCSQRNVRFAQFQEKLPESIKFFHVLFVIQLTNSIQIVRSIIYFLGVKNCNKNWWNYLKYDYHNSQIWYEKSYLEMHAMETNRYFRCSEL